MVFHVPFQEKKTHYDWIIMVYQHLIIITLTFHNSLLLIILNEKLLVVNKYIGTTDHTDLYLKKK